MLNSPFNLLSSIINLPTKLLISVDELESIKVYTFSYLFSFLIFKVSTSNIIFKNLFKIFNGLLSIVLLFVEIIFVDTILSSTLSYLINSFSFSVKGCDRSPSNSVSLKYVFTL